MAPSLTLLFFLFGKHQMRGSWSPYCLLRKMFAIVKMGLIIPKEIESVSVSLLYSRSVCKKDAEMSPSLTISLSGQEKT